MGAFREEEIRLRHGSIDPGGPPLTFAHLSDLHLRHWGGEHSRLVEAVNDRRVDFVFVTGDVFSQNPSALDHCAKLFRLLQPRHAAFAVRGNWEVVCGPPLRKLKALMRGWGATLLANESKVIATPAGRVRVSGLDDTSRGWPDLETALSPSPARASFSVLLSHAPLAASLLPPGHTVDLVLSGHTHGGQVRLPLVWRAIIPHGRRGFMDGLYEVNGTRLYVSRGFGGVGIVPLRFNCPPEVAFFQVLPRTD